MLIPTTIVQQNALSTGSWTPSPIGGGATEPTLGTGAIQTGIYLKIGGAVFFWCSFKFGTGMTPGNNNWRLTGIPFPISSSFPAGTSFDIGFAIGTVEIYDDSTGTRRVGMLHRWQTETNGFAMTIDNAAAFVGGTTPWTWADLDEFHAVGMYETDS